MVQVICGLRLALPQALSGAIEGFVAYSVDKGIRRIGLIFKEDGINERALLILSVGDFCRMHEQGK